MTRRCVHKLGYSNWQKRKNRKQAGQEVHKKGMYSKNKTNKKLGVSVSKALSLRHRQAPKGFILFIYFLILFFKKNGLFFPSNLEYFYACQRDCSGGQCLLLCTGYSKRWRLFFRCSFLCQNIGSDNTIQYDNSLLLLKKEIQLSALWQIITRTYKRNYILHSFTRLNRIKT